MLLGDPSQNPFSTVSVRICRSGMSALSPFSTQLRTLADPLGTAEKCQEATYAAQQRTLLFDDLIGHREQRWRHLDAERISRLQINNELEFGRLLDR